jgi:site-specific DNA-methyltransferase (adenine-specific)
MMLASACDAEAHHADWRELLEVVRERGGCDALIVDAPYSAVIHRGLNALMSRDLSHDVRDINYGSWDDDDVTAFVEAWSPLVRGWIVSITDHNLFGAWKSAMDRCGRRTFQDVPAVIRGMSVCFLGDGPSSWAVHCVVGRTRSKEMARWGTLPGAYVGRKERMSVVGGKPLWLMEALVRDYSRPGDLVVDPCAGAGTTLVACQRLGRRAIGGDAMLEHAQLAADRISQRVQGSLFT